MEKAPISNRLFGFLVLYDMHTDFFYRAIDGISDDDAHQRLDTKANHVAWIAGSLLNQRYEMAHELGVDITHKAEELFKNNKGIHEGTRYPTLAEYKKDWETISPVLREAFANATDERLDQPFNMPGMTMSFFELVSFMIYREANCIGHIALWRRLLGYPALNYM